MNQLTIVQRLAIYALPLLFALTLREMMRAQLAYRLGDSTGAQLGRLSFNPLKFVDPIGTVILPLVMLALSPAGLGGFLIGWPRVVPIDPNRLNHPQRDLGLIALAGLGANLVMAILWGVLLKIAVGVHAEEGLWLGVSYMAFSGVLLNTGFFVLNLLPFPPFDGGRVLIALLPPKYARQLINIEPYAFIILLLLMVTNILSSIIMPPMLWLIGLIFVLLGISSASLSL